MSFEIKRYRKRPVVVQAVRFTDRNGAAVAAWCGGKLLDDLIIPTLEGDMRADVGDYIIRGVNGEFYPCKPDIFEKTYESEEK